jgi:hypothetical protein
MRGQGTFAIMLAISACAASTVLANDLPYAGLPDSFVGMTNGALIPKQSVQPYIGSSQTSQSSSGGQTGRQVYFGGFQYRGNQNWQFGSSLLVFDDLPDNPVAGSMESITQFNAGFELKYQFAQTNRFSASLLSAAEWMYFSRGESITTQSSIPSDEKSNSLAATLSVPMTYRLGETIWASAELGYTHAPSSFAGEPGLGGRPFVSAGLAYRATDRLFAYGSVKALKRTQSGAIDIRNGNVTDLIYTVGGQFALTPQSALNIYATNAFGTSPVSDDFMFYPDDDEFVFGAVLKYIPSGKGVGENAQRFYALNSPSKAHQPLLPDGFTIASPHTLPSDQVYTRLSYSSSGQKSLATYYTAEPDFQFEFAIEDYVINADTGFRTEEDEDTRYMIGGRWQAMSEDYTHPFNLGFRILAGRDIQKPSLGVFYAEASASKTFENLELTIAPRAAFYASETLAGLGAGINYTLNEKFSAIGEYTLTQNSDQIWALGARYNFPSAPLSIDLYSTNSSGLNGIGTLLDSGEAQIGISLHWHTDFDWL